MDEHLIITLHVLDRAYRLKIKRKDEKIYRDAADAIEKKTNQYRKTFKGVDVESLSESDYMAMTTIQALSENVDLSDQNKLYEGRLKALTEELDMFLRKHR